MSDVPRSLQSCVSTIQTIVLTAEVFQLFIKHRTTCHFFYVSRLLYHNEIKMGSTRIAPFSKNPKTDGVSTRNQRNADLACHKKLYRYVVRSLYKRCIPSPPGSEVQSRKSKRAHATRKCSCFLAGLPGNTIKDFLATMPQ